MSTLHTHFYTSCDTIYMSDASIRSYLHDPLTTRSNEDTFLQDFLVILKLSLQIYTKILKECFLCRHSMITVYKDMMPLTWCYQVEMMFQVYRKD